jgi:type III restriction enzyme
MPKKGRGKGGKLDPLSLPTELQTALEALYGHYEKTFELWQQEGIKRAALLHRRLQQHRDSKLVYDYISGFHRTTTTARHAENGRLRCSATSTRTATRWPRPNTLLIDSEQLESGDALDDNFRAWPPTRSSASAARSSNAPAMRAADNLTDQDLLREVMNTVGKPGQLGESIRCVVSVSMLTEGWDANTVTHVLGVRAFGTQLLCEQVIGRALRRQSYELNDEGPVQRRVRRRARHPLRLHRQAGGRPAAAAARDHPRQGRRPERDALEIRFPRVEGYRVELPEERLTATSTTTPTWN